jgi:two-component system, OmpR family, response regulator
MKKPRVLLTEDDVNFGSVLKDYLELNDFDVNLCKNGNQGISSFKNYKYDICILDVMMPEKDGFTLAKEIRQLDQKVPLIFLTAKTLKEDMLEGFRSGADDYLTKPFDSEILLYKIRAILHRKNVESELTEPDEYKIGNYDFNHKLRKLAHNKDEFKLSPKEADLLKMLSIRMNDVLQREEALVKIWGEDNYFTTRSMDVYVTKLRKYLKNDPQIELINLHRNGFMLKVDKND